MLVEGEGAAAEVHVLDEVLAHAREAQEGAAVAIEDVARQDEEHDVEEELLITCKDTDERIFM